MDNSVKVAVVRGDRRRGAVAEALALIADDLRRHVQTASNANPVLIPNLDNPARQWASTHRDALAATVDAVLAAGASSITVTARSPHRNPNAAEWFRRLGYRAELWGRPVEFRDIDAAAGEWTTIQRQGPGGEPAWFRVPSFLTASRCRISLAVARTHDVFRVGLGLPNLGGMVHRDDRSLSGWGGTARDLLLSGKALPGGHTAACLWGSWHGWLARAWWGIRWVQGGLRLTRPERRRLDAVERATSHLVALAGLLLPQVSLVDGFVGMQGEGPRHGSRVRLGAVIAGTDAVAVDAVAALIMGFEPLEIAYLRQAQAAGLGVADLAAITVVGDPWSEVRRRFRRHSSDRLLRLASSRGTRPIPLPQPHFAAPAAGSHARTER